MASQSSVPAKREANTQLPASQAGAIVPRPAVGAIGGSVAPMAPQAAPEQKAVPLGRLLRRWGILVVGGTLGGGLLGGLLTLTQDKVFQARSLVEIQPLNADFLNLKNVDPSAVEAKMTLEAYIQTQVEVLQSHSLLDRTVVRLAREGNLPPLPDSQVSSAAATNGAAHAPSSAGLRQAVKVLRSNLHVTPLPSTNLIELKFESTQPEFAAHFLNALNEEFMDQNLENRSVATQRTGKWLGRQLEDLGEQLRNSEERLQNYIRTQGLLTLGQQDTPAAEEKLRQIQQQLSDANADRVAKQSKLETAKGADPESIPEVRDFGPLNAYQVELTNLRRELAELESTLTPAHYKVQRVQAKIASLEESARKERANILNRLQNDFETAQRREKLLSENYLRQAREVSDQAAKAVQLVLLKQEVESNRQLYNALIQRVREATLASAIPAGNVRVVDEAEIPLDPAKPIRWLNAALGLFTGLFASLGFVVWKETTDTSVRRPGETPRFLHVPELGVIPRARPELGGWARLKNLRLVIRWKRLAAPSRTVEVAEWAGEESQRAPRLKPRLELMTWFRKASPQAEGYRAAIASLLLSASGGVRPRVIIVSSAGPEEGKTTTACNLAAALASLDRRVLLIDADFRRPRLHEIFQAPNHYGIQDLLRDKSPIQYQPLDTLIRATEIPGLCVLPSGTPQGDASELLYSERLPELLLRCRRMFHTVLIDTAPMLLIPDARVLSRVADGLALVLRAGQTPREEAVSCVQRCFEDGTQVLGTVLVDWDPTDGQMKGYRKYHSHYYEKGALTPQPR